MIKSTLLVFIFKFFLSSLQAEEVVLLWVGFKDKDHSPYSLSRPHEFLSHKSIERRLKQNIAVDYYDLPVSRLYVDSILSQENIGLMYTSRWFNGAMFKVTEPALIDWIKALGFVSETEISKRKISKKEGKKAVQSVDSEQQEYKMLNGSFPYSSINKPNGYVGYGASEVQISMLNGQSLHEKGYWGNGRTIAVLDAGYRSVDTMTAFEDLWIYGKILGYYDFVQAKEELFQGHSHGTHVFSVMGANVPGIYTGVAPAASYWLLRTEDGATEFRVEEYNWLAGAEFSDSVGVDIINSSLGYTEFDDENQNYTYQDMDGSTTVIARAANLAFTRGILVVNSAGNYGTRPWAYIGSPADGHGVLAVGGTDSDTQRVAFSSVGPTFDGRVKPQVMAQGQGVAIVNNMGAISNANGTSFSAPLIAGLAACLWEKFPDATNSQIKKAIIRSADRYFKPDSLYGFGLPDFKYAAALLEKQLDDNQFLKLLQNPLMPESALSVYAFEPESISVDLFNSSGQKVWTIDSISVLPGLNDIKPFSDISRLSAGIYLIRVNFQKRTELVKAIKL
jgi:serine protease AprX